MKILKTENFNNGYYKWIKLCNTFDLSNFVPFICSNKIIGWIPKNKIKWFDEERSVFDCSPEKVKLSEKLISPKDRTSAIAKILLKWKNLNRIPNWRDEKYSVYYSFKEKPLFQLERAAALIFGIRCYGVHLNGIFGNENNQTLWIAKRSNLLKNFPGYLDHIVAGGLTAGLKPSEVLIKECHEEANIPSSLANKSKSVGVVSLFMDHKGFIKNDILFCYDLVLPENFKPKNLDGEVESFNLKTYAQLKDLILKTEKIKLNCNLVMIHFLIRHGIITPENSNYIDLIKGLNLSLDLKFIDIKNET